MNDTPYMKLALSEAQKGFGRTSPNPCVGAVIVKDGLILGKGYHKKAGSPHAEINALAAVKDRSVAGATMYVTLEPCSHTGKTPPCCRSIVNAQIGKVVVGMTDPNPSVNGRGIKYLQDHGIEVVNGVLKQECEEINFPFIKYIKTGLPWVIMKAGLSLDGKLNYQRGNSGWITGSQSSEKVHRLRDQVDAIMIGKGTLRIDDPSLTTRIDGKITKDPHRVILDTHLSADLRAKVFTQQSNARTFIACDIEASTVSKNRFLDLGVELIEVELQNNRLNLQEILVQLGKKEICSLLVEGGAQVHGAFLREQLIDYAYLFYAPLFAGDGGVSLLEGTSIPSRRNAPRLSAIRYKQYGEDLMISGQLQY